MKRCVYFISLMAVFWFSPINAHTDGRPEHVGVAITDPCRAIFRDRHRWRTPVPPTQSEQEYFRQCAITYSTSYRPNFAMMVAQEGVSPAPLPEAFRDKIIAAYKTRALNDETKLVIAENYVRPQFHPTLRRAAGKWLVEVANSNSICRHVAMHIIGTFEYRHTGFRVAADLDGLEMLRLAAAQRYVPAMIDYARIRLNQPQSLDDRVTAYAHLLHADMAGADVSAYLSKYRRELSDEGRQQAMEIATEQKASGRTIVRSDC